MSNEKQYEAALDNMIKWLEYPSELGKTPSKIEAVTDFEYDNKTYYVFKFKDGIFGKWMLGVCGGFEGDELIPCGHTFSDLKPYNETTAKEDSIVMIHRIMDYWREQSRLYSQTK